MIKIKLDKRNTNLHTPEGMELLDKSVKKVGVIESYTISNDGVVISGNARHEIIKDNFTKEPIVIETDGTEAIIIKRTDIESNTKKFHEASILANTTAHKNYNLDTDLIEEIIEEFDIDKNEMGIEDVLTDEEKAYTTKVDSPIYEPKEEKPNTESLYNLGRYDELMNKISESNISDKDKLFLQLAATRHIEFNYKNIAEYYAHSDKETQELMENSALVIIDYKKAIELGFVKLYETINTLSEIDE
jgi:hypothetical protein